MTRGSTLPLFLSVAGLIIGSWTLKADIPANPYQGIVERNLFNLKPPADAGAGLPPQDPPPKITLTGFTTILGDKRVLFKVQVPPKPPQNSKEESFILTEGQRDGDIEVLSIDENAGVAKFNNHGTIQTLNLATDGSKPSAVPPPIAAASPSPRPNSPFGSAPNGSQPPGPMKAFPSRSLRLPQVPSPPANRTFPIRPGAGGLNVAQ